MITTVELSSRNPSRQAGKKKKNFRKEADVCLCAWGGGWRQGEAISTAIRDLLEKSVFASPGKPLPLAAVFLSPSFFPFFHFLNFIEVGLIYNVVYR